MSATDAETTIGSSGYTLEDLAAYRHRGRLPRIAAIEDDAECQVVLDELERLASLSHRLIEEDALPVDTGWLDRLMTGLGRELRAGRDLPFPGSTPERRLVATEGAIRDLVRRAGDAVDGVFVGRCRIGGGGDMPHVRIALTVIPDRPLHDIADDVRTAVAGVLQRDTPLQDAVIDIVIEDLLPGGRP